jgi:hypothetical protein
VPHSLISTSFRTIAQADLSSAFFLHLLTPIDFRSFSTLSNHLNFGLPAFLLPSGFPINTFFTVLSSDILTTWPAHCSLRTRIVVTIFGFLYITCNSSLVRIHMLISVWHLDESHVLGAFTSRRGRDRGFA